MVTDAADADDLLLMFRRTFVEEATSILADGEAALVSLEIPDKRERALTEVFRAYHSIKGSAASVGFLDMAHLGHLAEDCLTILRARPALVTCDVVSLLLEVNDALKTRLATLLTLPDGDPSWDTSALQEQLKTVTASLSSSGAAQDPEAPAGQPAKEKERDKEPAGGMAFKIDAAKVDAVMDMVGELVVIKSQLVETIPPGQRNDARTKAVISLLDKSVRELHEKTLAMRMLSLKTCFLKMQRTARDLSQRLGKPIDFRMTGEDTELDRALIEQISDPLMHLCRNAIDHGIEAQDDRRRLGKPAEGRVSLKAFRRGDGVVIEITDDGGGIRKQRVLEKAASRGLIHQDAGSMSDAQIFDLLFHPGLSTAAEVTDVSGRGVGLDVVKANLAAVKGRVEVESQEGKGSCFRMLIPLTTAITDGIIVELGRRKYIIPVECIRSFVEAKLARVLPLRDGRSAVGVGGRHHALLEVPGLTLAKTIDEALFVLIEVMDRTFALAVDAVHGKAQVVLKGLRGTTDESGYFSGAAVMGDGKVALVLDVIGLAATAGERADLAA